MRRKFYTILRDGAKSLTIVPENTRMVALQTGGTRPPFYIVDSYPYFIDVVKLLGPDHSIVSLIGHEEMLEAGNYSIANEAAQHVQTILEHQPLGPYIVGGCSASGIVAYEVAQQMTALGHEMGQLVLFDTPNPYYMREYSAFWMSLNCYRDELHRLTAREIPSWVAKKFSGLIAKRTSWFQNGSVSPNEKQDQLGPSDARIDLARKYRPAPYSGRVLLFKRTRELTGRYLEPRFGWSEAVSGSIEVCELNAADHLEIFKSEMDRAVVVRKLQEGFSEAIGTSAETKAYREPGIAMGSEQHKGNTFLAAAK